MLLYLDQERRSQPQKAGLELGKEGVGHRTLKHGQAKKEIAQSGNHSQKPPRQNPLGHPGPPDEPSQTPKRPENPLGTNQAKSRSHPPQDDSGSEPRAFPAPRFLAAAGPRFSCLRQVMETGDWRTMSATAIGP